ncbi:MAG: hypothetical protein IPJ46_17545 [Anaerolineales bacterium]|nr:hypothetical protein [Anaerolineales bacterium]
MPFYKLVREYAEAAGHRIDRELGSEKIEICMGTGGKIEEMGNLASFQTRQRTRHHSRRAG